MHVEIPDAGHHGTIDQPPAFADAQGESLAAWPEAKGV